MTAQSIYIVMLKKNYLNMTYTYPKEKAKSDYYLTG